MPCEKDAEIELSEKVAGTTPVAEWEIVKRKRQPPDDPSGTRRIPNIEELMSLDTAKEAKLIVAEVIAIVLYTGPMVSHDDDF